MTIFKMKLRATAIRLLVPTLLGSVALGTSGCFKTPDIPAPQDYSAIDDAALKQYITAQKITNAQPQPSGLYFVPDSVNTTLPLIKNGQHVSVLYTGQLLNGTVFDASSMHGNNPFSFVLGAGQVIPGWDIGVALMHKGDKARLLIPSALAYGSAGAGATIPPNSPLVFTVKVVDVQ